MKLYVLTIVEPEGEDLIQRVFHSFEEAKEGYLAYLGSWVADIVFEDKENFSSDFFANPQYYSDNETELYADFGTNEYGYTYIYIKEFKI